MADRNKSSIFSILATSLVASMVLATVLLATLVGFNVDHLGAMVKFVQHNERSIDPAWTGSLNARIDHELLALEARVQADRGTVGRFHNGKVDLQGIHFVYISRTNEVDRPGVENDINRFQNIPTSMFNQEIYTYISGECVIRQAILPYGDGINQYYHFLGIRSSVRCPIFDSQHKLVAQAGVEFSQKALEGMREKEVVEQVKYTTLHIQEILNTAQ